MRFLTGSRRERRESVGSLSAAPQAPTGKRRASLDWATWLGGAPSAPTGTTTPTATSVASSLGSGGTSLAACAPIFDSIEALSAFPFKSPGLHELSTEVLAVSSGSESRWNLSQEASLAWASDCLVTGVRGKSNKTVEGATVTVVADATGEHHKLVVLNSRHEVAHECTIMKSSSLIPTDRTLLQQNLLPDGVGIRFPDRQKADIFHFAFNRAHEVVSRRSVASMSSLEVLAMAAGPADSPTAMQKQSDGEWLSRFRPSSAASEKEKKDAYLTLLASGRDGELIEPVKLSHSKSMKIRSSKSTEALRGLRLADSDAGGSETASMHSTSSLDVPRTGSGFSKSMRIKTSRSTEALKGDGGGAANGSVGRRARSSTLASSTFKRAWSNERVVVPLKGEPKEDEDAQDAPYAKMLHSETVALFHAKKS